MRKSIAVFFLADHSQPTCAGLRSAARFGLEGIRRLAAVVRLWASLAFGRGYGSVPAIAPLEMFLSLTFRNG
jgi:hypothetical protein